METSQSNLKKTKIKLDFKDGKVIVNYKEVVLDVQAQH